MKRSGAVRDADGCHFRVWAPLKTTMQLHLTGKEDCFVQMHKDEEGYFSVYVPGVSAGARYQFSIDGSPDLPDPVSNFQPDGVHGPSQVIDHDDFLWTDSTWQPASLKQMIFYELHVGTFTPEGTFESIIERLDALAATGINAIELMPVGQFPGNRNWGYDGVFPYAVQHSYGGPGGLKKLVDACHSRQIAVFLDVIYNHVGPEGNYLDRYGPYFTNTYSTPWGNAINFDGEWSDGVREFFAGNALYWFECFHIDGLRCDAVHMVYDNGSVHFWEYLHQEVQQLQQRSGRTSYLVAESDFNNTKVIRSPDTGGFGFDAQWLDDFHHALYTLLDVNGRARYEDYGTLSQLAKAYTDGFVLSGDWVKFRKKRYGASSVGVPGDKFVVFNQNHDQIGNRVKGERLSALVDQRRLKLAAAAVMLSPYIPMLFMGEEYGDKSPFYYFISHSDPKLIRAVQEGRRKEFAAFGFDGEVPDPNSDKVFNECKLKWGRRNVGAHAHLLKWHQTLISMRRSLPALGYFEKDGVFAETVGEKILLLKRNSPSPAQSLVCVFNFSEEETTVELGGQPSVWNKLLDSEDDEAERMYFLPQTLEGRSMVMPPLAVAVYEQEISSVFAAPAD